MNKNHPFLGVAPFYNVCFEILKPLPFLFNRFFLPRRMVGFIHLAAAGEADPTATHGGGKEGLESTVKVKVKRSRRWVQVDPRKVFQIC